MLDVYGGKLQTWPGKMSAFRLETELYLEISVRTSSPEYN